MAIFTCSLLVMWVLRIRGSFSMSSLLNRQIACTLHFLVVINNNNVMYMYAAVQHPCLSRGVTMRSTMETMQYSSVLYTGMRVLTVYWPAQYRQYSTVQYSTVWCTDPAWAALPRTHPRWWQPSPSRPGTTECSRNGSQAQLDHCHCHHQWTPQILHSAAPRCEAASSPPCWQSHLSQYRGRSLRPSSSGQWGIWNMNNSISLAILEQNYHSSPWAGI